MKQIKKITEELEKGDLKRLNKFGMSRILHIYQKIDEMIVELNKIIIKQNESSNKEKH